MFRPNDNHNQQTLSDSTQWMNKKIREKLDKSWAPIWRFLAEQSTADAESGKLIPKPKKEISSASLQSAYDEDATFRRKGNVSQSGYVLEISETCDKSNPFQLITDYTVEPNITSDVEIHLTNMSGTEPTKKLPVTEFDIDKTTNVINKCPGGYIPTRAE